MDETGESMVGYATHLLAIPSRLSPGLAFDEHLVNTRAGLLDAYEHQAYPFSGLLNDLQVKRDLRSSPLVTAIFNLDHPSVIPEMLNLEVEWYDRPIGFSPFDLFCNITDIAGELVVEYDFNADLFDASTVRRTLGHFQTLLQSIAADPGQRISHLPLLTEDERHQLLFEWNDTAAPFPHNVCIYQVFEDHVQRQPDALALVFQQQLLTYGELNRRANQLAHFLRNSGVGPEVPVGVYLERGPAAVTALLGIWKAGGAYVPLVPAYPRDRLAFLIADAEMPLVLTQEALRGDLPAGKTRSICIDADWNTIAQEPMVNPVPLAKTNNLAYIIYTSGSTGKPKGSLIEHRGLTSMSQDQVQRLGVGSGTRVLQFCSLSFDVSIYEIVMALGSGATLCLARQEDLMPGSDLLRTVRDLAVNIIVLPPSALEATPWADLPDLEVIIAAGEVCPAELVSRWAPGRRFFNLYGPTETTVVATMHECSASDEMPPIGRPIANTQAYILDGALQPVPVGVVGELCVGGVSVGRGYLRRPELTADKFVADPFNDDPHANIYRTGDLARYRSDGTIEFLGRIDNQVKLRGYRIELGEIEAVLSRHPAVRKAVVLLRQDRPGDARLVAYLLGQAREPDLREYLATQIPQYMIPAAFVNLDAFPLLPSGKVDRRALPEPAAITPRRQDSPSLPETELERLIAMIWQEVLGAEQVGIHDSFFELGGHSLHAVQVQSRLQQSLGRDLPIVTLFQYPTVRLLAGYLADEQDATQVHVGRGRAEIRKARRSLLRQSKEGG